MHSEKTFFSQFFNSLVRCKTQGLRPLVLFDIDSTLVHVHKRNQAILHDYFKTKESQDRSAEGWKKLKDVAFLPQEWGLKETFARAQVEPHHFENSTEIFSHWEEKFFSNEFLHHDVLVQGALEFTQEVEKAGAKIIYLTGRDIGRMLFGTIEYFKQWRLPLHQEAELRLKPHARLSDEEFKREELLRLKSQFSSAWFFENEPVNLALAEEIWPDLHLVFLNTTHSRRKEPPAKATRLDSFAGFLDWKKEKKS